MGWDPDQQPLIGKLLTVTNSTVMHCFIDTQRPFNVKKLNMAKNIEILLSSTFN